MLYLDANATSRLRPEAARALSEFLRQEESLKNPSSVHRLGRNARALLTAARKAVISLLTQGGNTDVSLFFTSGGTEACNTLIHGFLPTSSSHGLTSPGHLVTSQIEHPAMLEPVKLMQGIGWEATYVAPEPSGIVTVSAVLQTMRNDTALVSLMAANNETGALQPVEEIARTLRQNGFRGIIVSDITQAVGKSTVNVLNLFEAGVNAVGLSGHKLGALSGIGAIAFPGKPKGVVDACYSFSPFLLGGPQENRFRAGTENLPGIITFGAVAEALSKVLFAEVDRISTLREELWEFLSETISGIVRLTPPPGQCLSNTLLIYVPRCRGDDLVVALDHAGVAASTGSACSSGKQEPSHVVRAMGFLGVAGREVIRLSLDWDASRTLVREASEIIREAVFKMRETTAPFQDAPSPTMM